MLILNDVSQNFRQEGDIHEYSRSMVGVYQDQVFGILDENGKKSKSVRTSLENCKNQKGQFHSSPVL